MLELPEVIIMQRDLSKSVLGKKVKSAIANSSPHKFAFYSGDPGEYSKILKGKTITSIEQYGFYISLELEDKQILFRDGVNLRYHNNEKDIPNKHQLLIEFTDGSLLSSTVAMYGLIFCGDINSFNDNEYFKIAYKGILPISSEFNYKYFDNLLSNCKETASSKAFLATEQRIVGVGNGVTQDILFNAKIHPKKKINTYSEEDKQNLFNSIKDTLDLMSIQNGRDTEKDLYANFGKYKTILSKNTVGKECPICKNIIKKENFLGGSIYFCDNCQKL